MTTVLFVLGFVLLVGLAIYVIFLMPTPRTRRALGDVLDPTPELPDDDVEGYDRAHGGGW